MNDLRTAAQQALEALKTGGWNMTTRAIADLERALAQQDEPEGSVCARCGALAFDPVLPQQAEPVATLGYARKIERLIAQRDDLLQALKKIRGFTVDGAVVYAAMIDINSVASRAIKAAEAKE